MQPPSRENQNIAARLREAAERLAEQGANPFRVNAYRRAAGTVAALGEPLRALFNARGHAGLSSLPGIGEGIASAIAEMLVAGRWSQLDRLRGEVDAVKVFQVVPGIGAELAHAIHETLQIDTLEALELACRDGRLERLPSIGPRRAAAICAALTALLDRRRAIRRVPSAAAPAGEPSIEVLLELDREYRDKATAGGLPRIAPKRFNPGGEAWLPVLHAKRGRWHFTVLYSNTARAHELDKVRDWVVLYFYDDRHVERQHTVVTETRGALVGRRVVRGREAECRGHYAAKQAA